MSDLEKWLNVCISWYNMAQGNCNFSKEICNLGMFSEISEISDNTKNKIHIQGALKVATELGIDYYKRAWAGNKYSVDDKYDEYGFLYKGHTFYSLVRRCE